jgi:hypothetical protein
MHDGRLPGARNLAAMGNAARASSALETVPSERLATLVTAATYGAVIVLGAVVLATPRNVESGYGLELVLGAGVATWVAHVFADLVGDQLRQNRPLDGADLRNAMTLGSPILVAALFPSLALIPGRLELVSGQTALWLAAGIGILELVGIGGFVAYVHRSREVHTWRFVLAVALVGVAVVLVKIFLGRH